MTYDIQRIRHPRERRYHPLHPLESSKKEAGAPPTPWRRDARRILVQPSTNSMFNAGEPTKRVRGHPPLFRQKRNGCTPPVSRGVSQDPISTRICAICGRTGTRLEAGDRRLAGMGHGYSANKRQSVWSSRRDSSEGRRRNRVYFHARRYARASLT
jgi:hypothetical protein